ncbi:MAG: sigma 54-interacting transcriptional regulator [Ignavibacteriae bacterium]|nr:sigma 54-interacting transcriptional regulator [Ignavibacteriota bacterium]
MEQQPHLQDAILDSLSEGVFTVDKEFRIIFFNSAAEKITGLQRDEVLGQFCKNVLHSEFCASLCPIAAVLETGKNVVDVESKIQCGSGKVTPIKLNAAILRGRNNKPVGGVVSFRDISDDEHVRDLLRSNTHFYGIVGTSKSMQDIYTLIQEITESDASVFIQGETGTGKEVIANAIQATSRRRQKRFVKVNCAVLPQHLLASELFGHAKGAFTDAIKDRVGRFEFADKGTLFLDEIAEMPVQTQLQLLRILQDGTYERVGESLARKADVRIIAATNVDVQQAIADGRLRGDLFYRLNVIPIIVPPLRERKEDIPSLVEHFIQKYALKYKKAVGKVESGAMDAFMTYAYPGNVRQLENFLEYAFIRTRPNNPITTANLPICLRDNKEVREKDGDCSNVSTPELILLLQKHRYNKTKVAKEMGVDRTTVWRRLRALGIRS